MLKQTMSALFLLLICIDLTLAGDVSLAELPTLKPELIMGRIIEYENVAMINEIFLKRTPSSEQSKEGLFFHEGYKKELLDSLCNKIGYGDGIDWTYRNVSSPSIRDQALYLYKDGNVVLGAKIKKEIQQNYNSEETSVLNGFFCEIR